jgi:hypothetical protein
MATLADLYTQWQADQSDFRRIHYWDNGLADGSGGWNNIYNTEESGTPPRDRWLRDEGSNSFRGYQVKGDPGGGLDFRSSPLLHEAGYEFLDLANVQEVADRHFGGDVDHALEYRYGAGYQIVNDARFADDGAMAGVFIKPRDPARLHADTSDRYPLYVNSRR